MEIDFGVMFFSSTDAEFKDGKCRIFKIKHTFTMYFNASTTLGAGAYYRFAHVSLPVQRM